MASGDGYSYHQPPNQQDPNLRRTTLPAANDSGYQYSPHAQASAYGHPDHTSRQPQAQQRQQQQQWSYNNPGASYTPAPTQVYRNPDYVSDIGIGGHAPRSNAPIAPMVTPGIIAPEQGTAHASAPSTQAGGTGVHTQSYGPLATSGEFIQRHPAQSIMGDTKATVASAVNDYLSSKQRAKSYQQYQQQQNPSDQRSPQDEQTGRAGYQQQQQQQQHQQQQQQQQHPAQRPQQEQSARMNFRQPLGAQAQYYSKENTAPARTTANYGSPITLPQQQQYTYPEHQYQQQQQQQQQQPPEAKSQSRNDQTQQQPSPKPAMQPTPQPYPHQPHVSAASVKYPLPQHPQPNNLQLQNAQQPNQSQNQQSAPDNQHQQYVQSPHQAVVTQIPTLSTPVPTPPPQRQVSGSPAPKFPARDRTPTTKPVGNPFRAQEKQKPKPRLWLPETTPIAKPAEPVKLPMDGALPGKRAEPQPQPDASVPPAQLQSNNQPRVISQTQSQYRHPHPPIMASMTPDTSPNQSQPQGQQPNITNPQLSQKRMQDQNHQTFMHQFQTQQKEQPSQWLSQQPVRQPQQVQQVQRVPVQGPPQRSVQQPIQQPVQQPVHQPSQQPVQQINQSMVPPQLLQQSPQQPPPQQHIQPLAQQATNQAVTPRLAHNHQAPLGQQPVPHPTEQMLQHPTQYSQPQFHQLVQGNSASAATPPALHRAETQSLSNEKNVQQIPEDVRTMPNALTVNGGMGVDREEMERRMKEMVETMRFFQQRDPITFQAVLENVKKDTASKPGAITANGEFGQHHITPVSSALEGSTSTTGFTGTPVARPLCSQQFDDGQNPSGNGQITTMSHQNTPPVDSYRSETPMVAGKQPQSATHMLGDRSGSTAPLPHPTAPPNPQPSRSVQQSGYGTPDPEKKLIAKLTADFLTRMGNKITAEYVGEFLRNTNNFVAMCEHFDSLGHVYDRGDLARHLIEAVPRAGQTKATRVPPDSATATPIQSSEPSAESGRVLGEIVDSSPVSMRQKDSPTTHQIAMYGKSPAKISLSREAEEMNPRSMKSRTGSPKKEGPPPGSVSEPVQTYSQNTSFTAPRQVVTHTSGPASHPQRMPHLPSASTNYSQRMVGNDASSSRPIPQQQVFNSPTVMASGFAPQASNTAFGPSQLSEAPPGQFSQLPTNHENPLQGPAANGSILGRSSSLAQRSNHFNIGDSPVLPVPPAPSAGFYPDSANNEPMDIDIDITSFHSPVSKSSSSRHRVPLSRLEQGEKGIEDRSALSSSVSGTERSKDRSPSNTLAFFGYSINGSPIPLPSGHLSSLKPSRDDAVPAPESVSEANKVHLQPKMPKLPLAENINKKKAARTSKYDSTHIARNILIVAGRHKTERPLNAHLLPLKDNLPGQIDWNSDLATVRWDILDPAMNPEMEVDMDGDDEGDGNATNEPKVGMSEAPQKKPRGRPRKSAPGNLKTPGDLMAGQAFTAQTPNSGSTIATPRSAYATTTRRLDSLKPPTFGRPKANSPVQSATMDSAPVSKKRRVDQPTRAIQQPGFGSLAFKKYSCKWQDCTATLHNLDNLRRHVSKLHKKHNQLYNGYPCRWAGCNRPHSKEQIEAVRAKRDQLQPIIWDFATPDEWKKHMDGHLEAVKQNMGVGPAALPSDQESAGSDVDYLSDHLGRRITPLAKPSKPSHKFVPPVGSKPNKQFYIAHNINPAEAKRTGKAAYRSALARARALGAGMEGDEVGDLLALDDGVGFMSEFKKIVPADWPPKNAPFT